MTLRRMVFVAAVMFVTAAGAPAAMDVKVDFLLKTTDDQGAAIKQNRFYYVYRPRHLPREKPAPSAATPTDPPPVPARSRE